MAADAVHEEHRLGMLRAGFGNTRCAKRFSFHAADGRAEHVQP